MPEDEEPDTTDGIDSATDEGESADERRMRVICNDGVSFDCGGYKAVDAGLVVFEDEQRERTMAFVPYSKLEYVLPVALADQYAGRAAPPQSGAVAQQQYQSQSVSQPAPQRPLVDQQGGTAGGAPGRPPNAGQGSRYPPSQ